MDKQKLIKQYQMALEKMPNKIKVLDKDVEYQYKDFKFILIKGTTVADISDDFIAMYYYLLKTLEKELTKEEFKKITNGEILWI